MKIVVFQRTFSPKKSAENRHFHILRRFFFTCGGKSGILLIKTRPRRVRKGALCMNLICLGDSITYGYGVRRAERWSTLVGAALGCTVMNHGISGDTTGGMLSRLECELMPDIRRCPLGQKPTVLLLGGVNDIFYSGTDTVARANLGAMVHQLITAGAKCVVLSPLGIVFSAVPPDWSEVMRPDTPALLEGYYRWQAQFCRAFGVPYIDLYDLLRKPDGTPDPALYLDGLHPTAEGHRLMAQRICNALR